jgi:uncharacterized membrane protein
VETSWNTYGILRGIHVLAIVLWIGGVAFVTTVLLPALRKKGGDYQTFEVLEHSFGTQAKVTTQLALVTGLGMLWITNGWERLTNTWWLWAMLLAYTVFTIMLFFLEPIVVHRLLHERSKKDPQGTLLLLQRLHYLLLTIGLVAAVGGTIGAHGGF